MGIAIVLTAIAILCRLLPPELGIWNFVPMGAVALYAGARLPRRWAWIVPVAAMALSDLALPQVTLLTRLIGYVTFGMATLLGPLAARPGDGLRRRILLLPALSLGVSIGFFLTSNFATWAEGLLYPLTLQGLLTCYYMGLPFIRNTVAADLLGTAILFGLGPIVERAYERQTRLQPVERA
jgi:hypothetical protein